MGGGNLWLPFGPEQLFSDRACAAWVSIPHSLTLHGGKRRLVVGNALLAPIPHPSTQVACKVTSVCACGGGGGVNVWLTD